MEVFAKFYPPELKANEFNETKLIIRVKNNSKSTVWVEANISLDHKISLTPDHTLRKGKIRVGILEPNEVIEKYVKIYGSRYTTPGIYKGEIVFFSYNKDGVIEERKELSISVECKPIEGVIK